MTYTKCAPFGVKESKGTFDDFYNEGKYPTLEEAYEAEDYVQVDFVKDEAGVLYFEAWNVKTPNEKRHLRLNFQNCRAGVDVMDDNGACNLAIQLL